MSYSHRELRTHPPGGPLRNLGMLVVAYLAYGALLFGTSAILADHAEAQIDLPASPIEVLDFGHWLPVPGAWAPSAARLGATSR